MVGGGVWDVDNIWEKGSRLGYIWMVPIEDKVVF